jgi:hypothetical protein
MNNIAIESGLYFENRDKGMWFAIFRYDVDEWAWWEGEVGCFSPEEINKLDREDTFRKWMKIANAFSGYKKAAVLKDPKEIAELVKSL